MKSRGLNLFEMAQLLPLPGDIQSFVAELARFEPTPSASAIMARLAECPWIRPMIDEFPHAPPSHLLLRAEMVGLVGCRKCNSCFMGTLHRIRWQLDEELADWTDEEEGYDP